MIIKKVAIPGVVFLLSMSLLSFKLPVICKSQGIKGHVYLIKGNQMPSPDIKPGPLKGFSTSIYIYELTSTSQVKKDGISPFYRAINTKLVKVVKSDKNGSFKVSLKPGEYSLFIKKDTLFFANRLDGRNNINPVKVDSCQFANLDIRADYDAVY